jgi:hypothetical protein
MLNVGKLYSCFTLAFKYFFILILLRTAVELVKNKLEKSAFFLNLVGTTYLNGLNPNSENFDLTHQVQLQIFHKITFIYF